MIWNGKEGDYNPTQMLAYCKVNAFSMGGEEHVVTAILAAMVAHTSQPEKLVEALAEIVQGVGRRVSIGRALDTLHSVAKTGNELDHGRDGLDALTYHLGGDTCKKGIEALQAVLRRFEVNAVAEKKQYEDWQAKKQGGN